MAQAFFLNDAPCYPRFGSSSRQRETLVLPERPLRSESRLPECRPACGQSIYLRPYCLPQRTVYSPFPWRERFSPGAAERSDCTDIRHKKSRDSRSRRCCQSTNYRPVKTFCGRPKKELWIATKTRSACGKTVQGSEWC